MCSAREPPTGCSYANVTREASMCDLDGDACVICIVTLRCDRPGQRGEPGPVSRLVK